MKTLLEDIRDAINRHSAENGSDTPDFILAQYLEQCLAAFDVAVLQREAWHGRGLRATALAAQLPTPETEADPRNPNVPGHEVAGHISQSTT